MRQSAPTALAAVPAPASRVPTPALADAVRCKRARTAAAVCAPQSTPPTQPMWAAGSAPDSDSRRAARAASGAAGARRAAWPSSRKAARARAKMTS